MSILAVATHPKSKHKHYVEKLNAYKMTLKVYNHLQKDDKVYLLSLCNGKVYYVLDRVAGQVAGKDI